MTELLKSKLILKPFIIITFPLLLLFAVLGIPKLISTINELQAEKTNDVTGVLIPILFLLLIIFILVKYLNCFPKLTIDRRGIMFTTLFNSIKYDWSEIENIELTGKKQFGTFFNTPLEATTFYFKNGELKHFWIEHYSNSPEIRIVLERAEKILCDKSSAFNNLEFNVYNEPNLIEDVELREKEVFNDNHALSANGIIFYGFLIFTLYIIFENPSEIIEKYDKLLVISLVCLVLCGGFSYTMNYFILTDKYLIVRNSIWFWKKEIYRIDGIKEIVIDMPFRSSICLRVINNNYKSKVYQGSSLRNKTWGKLISRLEQKNIAVRNEVNFG